MKKFFIVLITLILFIIGYFIFLKNYQGEEIKYTVLVEDLKLSMNLSKEEQKNAYLDVMKSKKYDFSNEDLNPNQFKVINNNFTLIDIYDTASYVGPLGYVHNVKIKNNTAYVYYFKPKGCSGLGGCLPLMNEFYQRIKIDKSVNEVKWIGVNYKWQLLLPR